MNEQILIILTLLLLLIVIFTTKPDKKDFFIPLKTYTYNDIINLFNNFILVDRSGLYNGTKFRIEYLMHLLGLKFAPFYYRCFLYFQKK